MEREEFLALFFCSAICFLSGLYAFHVSWIYEVIPLILYVTIFIKASFSSSELRGSHADAAIGVAILAVFVFVLILTGFVFGDLVALFHR